MSTRARMREALARAGGTAARGTVRFIGAPPVPRPFAPGRVVEGSGVRAIPVGRPESAPDGVGFATGILRWAVDGHVGLTPIVRASVEGAVLARHAGAMRCAAQVGEEFVVIPGGRLAPDQRNLLAGAGLPVVESDAGPRPHPLLDRWLALQTVQRRRDACTVEAARQFLAAEPEAWLVVDGAADLFATLEDVARVVGVVRAHETLFLEGEDLTTALTLAPAHRSSVFAREGSGGVTYSWYLRLWPWTEEDLLHGLARVERLGDVDGLDADRVSRWLLAERAPVTGPVTEWDRLLYPLGAVQTFLLARAGGWY